MRVKGKNKPVVIFEPICALGEQEDRHREELALHTSALAAYQQQHWPEAAEQFTQLQQTYPERTLYAMYLERIAYLQEHPPGPDWDGAFTFKTK